jgi:hypothetical protein
MAAGITADVLRNVRREKELLGEMGFFISVELATARPSWQ